MSTYTEILYQIVFASKSRLPFLTPQNQDALFKYIAGIVNNRRSFTYIIGGHKSHIHLIIFLHPSEALSDLVREIKKASHFWMLEKKEDFGLFPGWQVGYSAFTYDCSAKRNLIRYVENQAEHHKKQTYQQELVKVLNEFGIQYDEKYLFT